jgi:hypothetical protein
MHGDDAKVERLVHEHPHLDIDGLSELSSLTALEAAVMKNYIKIVKFLAINGARLSSQALQLAVAGHYFDVATFLVEKSQDPLYTSSVNRAGLGEISVNFLDVLGNTKDRVNSRDSTGNTPLHLASRHNHGGYIEWLLNKNANPLERDSVKQTAWDFALKIPAYDAIGVLAFTEMKHQRDTHGRNGTGLLFFYSGGMETDGACYSYGNTWHHFGGGSSVSGTL